MCIYIYTCKGGRTPAHPQSTHSKLEDGGLLLGVGAFQLKVTADLSSGRVVLCTLRFRVLGVRI